MQIDKQQIMDMLKSQIQSGGQDHADQAEQQLPQQVDTDPKSAVATEVWHQPARSDQFSRYLGM